MATVYFDGVGADAHDLSKLTNYSGGALPSAGDTLVFRSGFKPITAGLTALAAIALARVVLTDGWKGSSFGSEATGVSLQTTDLVISTTSAKFVKVLGATTLTNIDVQKLSGGTFMVVGGSPAITLLTAGPGPGTIDVADGVNVTTARSAGMAGILRSMTTSPADLELSLSDGAKWEVQRRVAMGFIDGRLNMTGAGALTHTTTASARCVVGSTGTLNLACTGTITRVERKRNSLLTFSDAPQDITIGTEIVHTGARKSSPTGITVATTTTILIGPEQGPSNPAA